jgi:probable HAF family extracellular repeat protein
MVDLGSLGGTCGIPSLINNRDQVVGQSDLAGDVYFHPFLWDRGILTDLGTFGGNYGQAIWLNDAGEAVGWATTQGDQVSFAALWRKGMISNLGTVSGDGCSTAYGINSKGQVIGVSQPCDGSVLHASLWENGGPMLDLNTLIPPDSPLILRIAYSINERGEISGIARLKSDFSKRHAFLLIPDGDCVSACEGRIVASHNNAAPAQNPAMMKQDGESGLSLIERFRSQMRQRYHLTSQPAAPRD